MQSVSKIAQKVQICDAAELVKLLQKGDIEVLDRVTRCFGDQLIAEARRRCRSAEEADDAVQDATLNAWRYGPGFRGEGKVDRWLVRLVATACNRMRRGMKRDANLHVHDTELLSDEETPEILAARAELSAFVGDALNGLSPRDRTIVLLADGQGWTGPEIATELHMTPGAVRSRLSRSHAKLRATLLEEGLV